MESVVSVKGDQGAISDTEAEPEPVADATDDASANSREEVAHINKEPISIGEPPPHERVKHTGKSSSRKKKEMVCCWVGDSYGRSVYEKVESIDCDALHGGNVVADWICNL